MTCPPFCPVLQSEKRSGKVARGLNVKYNHSMLIKNQAKPSPKTTMTHIWQSQTGGWVNLRSKKFPGGKILN